MELNDERLDALLARAHKEVDEGVLPSCQIAVALDGQVARGGVPAVPAAARLPRGARIGRCM